jgi:hypothetical protein
MRSAERGKGKIDSSPLLSVESRRGWKTTISRTRTRTTTRTMRESMIDSSPLTLFQ